jgi:hypothetical protein
MFHSLSDIFTRSLNHVHDTRCNLFCIVRGGGGERRGREVGRREGEEHRREERRGEERREKKISFGYAGLCL